MKKYNYTLYCVKCNVADLIYVDFTKTDIKHSIRFKKFYPNIHPKLKEISSNLDYEVLFSEYVEDKTKDEMEYLKNMLISKIYKIYDENKIINVNPEIKDLSDII
jgi:hypothetical protein